MVYNIEYDGLHIICPNCGCYRHLIKDCPNKLKEGDNKEVSRPANSGGDVITTNNVVSSQNHDLAKQKNQETPSQEVLHGEWFIVQRRKRVNKNSSDGAFKTKGSQPQKVHRDFPSLDSLQ